MLKVFGNTFNGNIFRLFVFNFGGKTTFDTSWKFVGKAHFKSRPRQ